MARDDHGGLQAHAASAVTAPSQTSSFPHDEIVATTPALSGGSGWSYSHTTTTTRATTSNPRSHTFPQHQHHDQSTPTPTLYASVDRQHRNSHHLSLDIPLNHSNTPKPTPKSKHKHKNSKSRDVRLPRSMTQFASSGKGLLPTWSGKEKSRDEDGLLRPDRMRWGGDEIGFLGTGEGSRKGSDGTGIGTGSEEGTGAGTAIEGIGNGVRRREVKTVGELEVLKGGRLAGEEYLRSALTTLGTLATDITRRLDYTYYNLLEKITSLNSTITSFQDLTTSTSTLFTDFSRETKALDADVRRQVDELGGFQPQIRKIEALEERMREGRRRVDELGGRLEGVRREIERWERREEEWQGRVGRRLRAFGGFMGVSVLVVVVAFVVRHWPDETETPGVWVTVDNGSHLDAGYMRGQSQSATGQTATPDPLRIFDEL